MASCLEPAFYAAAPRARERGDLSSGSRRGREVSAHAPSVPKEREESNSIPGPSSFQLLHLHRGAGQDQPQCGEHYFNSCSSSRVGAMLRVSGALLYSSSFFCVCSWGATCDCALVAHPLELKCSQIKYFIPNC